MTRDLQNIVRYRTVMSAVIRLLGLWLLITRPLPLLQQAIVMWWQNLKAPNFGGVRTGLVDQPWLIGNILQAVIFLALGMWLILGAVRLSNWMIPIPKPRCPGCRYDLGEAAPRLCPECGLNLSELQVSFSQSPEPNPQQSEE